MDLFYLIGLAAFGGLSLAFLRLCRRLGGWS